MDMYICLCVCAALSWLSNQMKLPNLIHCIMMNVCPTVIIIQKQHVNFAVYWLYVCCHLVKCVKRNAKLGVCMFCVCVKYAYPLRYVHFGAFSSS